MPQHNPHRGLDPLVEEIRRRDDQRLGIVYAWRFAELIPTRLGPLRRVAEYIELALRIWGERGRDHILLREFSTYFVFLTLLLVFPIRRKCVLLIAHNVQTAESKPREKHLLQWIARLGPRFACLESDAGMRAVLGVENALVFAHPVVACAPPQQPGGARRVVGVAGDLRPEKGLDLVIGRLSEAFRDDPDIDFRLGTNRVDVARQRWPQTEVSDTTAQSDYIAFLQQLDLLVLSYPEASYRYRASGVIAEATGCGTAVICTDLPCLRHQVMSPATGGAVLAPKAFAGEDIIDTIRTLAARGPQLAEALAENTRSREAAQIVDSILAQLA
jgi:glycosyltransferase involved in cell wall biosynthesis